MEIKENFFLSTHSVINKVRACISGRENPPVNRNIFLNETIKDTRKKIKSGEYKLTDLNGGI